MLGNVWKTLEQRADTDGREEADEVEVFGVELCQVARHGGVHSGLGVFELGFVEHFGVLGLLLIGAGEEEFLFAVLGKDFDEVGEILVAEEYLALTVLDVVLQVVGDGFCGAEILHGVGDYFTELFCKTEEMVDGILAVEDDGGVFVEVNP